MVPGPQTTPTLRRWPLPITLLLRVTASDSMAMAIFMASALLTQMLTTVMEVWAMATAMATSMASVPLMPMPTTATTVIQPTLLAMSTMESAPLMPMPTTAIQPTLLAMPTMAEKLHH